jgi:hypothetical protein
MHGGIIRILPLQKGALFRGGDAAAGSGARKPRIPKTALERQDRILVLDDEEIVRPRRNLWRPWEPMDQVSDGETAWPCTGGSPGRQTLDAVIMT